MLLLAAGLLAGSAAVAADEAKLTTMSGTVVSADAKSGSMLVKVDSGSGKTEDVTVVVPADAKIIKAGGRSPCRRRRRGEGHGQLPHGGRKEASRLDRGRNHRLTDILSVPTRPGGVIPVRTA
jgi:hypothetical protein